MNNKLPGFFTPSGSIAALLTVLIVVGVGWLRGGILFNPGPLNAKTGAPLGGVSSHAALTTNCSACHTAFWNPVSMSDRCSACHTDIAAQLKDPASIHGVFKAADPGLDCRTCHSEHKGAHAPMTNVVNMEFPHEALGYALTAHRNRSDGTPFSCPDCHGQAYTAVYDQQTCTSCHQKVKPGFMSAHLETYGQNCLGCHDGVDSYGHAFNHNAVPFHLAGKHAGLDCGQCHAGARSIALLKATPQDCSSCHAKNDPHQGQLGTDCAACHTPAGWVPSTFDHNSSGFKLIGKHSSVVCTGCHVNAVFKGTPTDCYSCHARDDKHSGQFGTACDACHSPADWLPITFDHNSSSFKLIGKHAGVPCAGCHVNAVLKGTPTDCYSCHARDDRHNGQYGTACDACHSPNGWLPATFDHSLFPLTGGHAGLPCTRCHMNGVFTGLSTTCSVCHADPAFHAGLFAGTSCNACHSTLAWIPATYDGPHPGGCDGNCIHHEGATCRDCHTASLMTATCTKCHGSNNPGGGD